ncbi:hypothetical protein LSH36_512g01009 [Paralvinella palmiformis]|uniref:Cadherin domain-containing protein n=1 Tax=Paralvinella palmiformis TaxID=53620 RepID=A0AAD9MWC1_9ANNE|nr:hypothetical protein LSH36_512g01009 [Paralvinella palmiformis]
MRRRLWTPIVLLKPRISVGFPDYFILSNPSTLPSSKGASTSQQTRQDARSARSERNHEFTHSIFRPDNPSTRKSTKELAEELLAGLLFHQHVLVMLALRSYTELSPQQKGTLQKRHERKKNERNTPVITSGSFVFGSCSGSIGSTGERSTHSTTSSDQRFLVTSRPFTCHGQVEQFSFYRRYPYCYNFQLQIWRPVDVAASRFMLLGTTDYVNSPACWYWNSTYYTRETKMVDPRPIDEVPLQPGDVFGWTDSNPGTSTRTLSYNSAPTGSGTYDTVEILSSGSSCSTGIGRQCDWSGSRTTVRDYNLRIYFRGRQNPYFTNLPATIQMLENSAVGTYVYKVRGWNHFSYSSVIDPDIRFSISSTTCDTSPFSIDPITGVIKIASANALNHEPHLSGGISQCTITARVSEGPFTGTEVLTIVIGDVNEPHKVTNLPEQKIINSNSAGDNYVVHDVDYSEIDTNTASGFPAKVFRIEYTKPTNAPFDIDSNGVVRTTRSLVSWAGPTRFILGITVEDDTHRDGPHELTIAITNLRTIPIITNVDHSISIPENSVAANPTIFQVEGDSQPDGRGDPVKYYLMHIYPLNTTVDTFAINPTTGWISHKANPGFDYFGVRLYDLELEVRDSDIMYVSERKNLSIEITWINKPPKITTTFATSIEEKVFVGTALPNIELDGTDRDIPVGDWIDYQVYGTDSYLFAASNITDRIYVTQEITVPAGLTEKVYNLQLLVYDSHGEKDSTTLTVTVLDINDNAPIFNPDYYVGKILETSPGGTTTSVTVQATDKDGGNNKKIYYSIIEDLGNLYFQVDQTGHITNKQPIPGHIYQNITFTVVATDGGEPSLNDTATVFVEIQEANTNEPYFDPDFYSLDLRSDTRIGTNVHTIPAADKDSDAVQNISYFWISLEDYFDLEPETGIISVSRELLPFQKHLMYAASTDNGIPGSYDSDPYSIRIDTYLPESTLIDIYLDIPLEQFLPTVDRFMARLDKTISPWDMRLESYRLDDTSTVARVYAVESALPDLKVNQEMQKIFIDKEKLLLILRSNLRGEPSDVLKEETFAEWQPYKVHPAYPVWITETVGGVVFLSLLCLLFLIGLITLLVLHSKKYRWGCYRYRPSINKRKVYPKGGDDRHFKLNYITEALSMPYFISNNKLLGKTFAGVFPPRVLETPASEPKSAGIGKGSEMRTSLVTKEGDDDRLTPVQTPDKDSSRRTSLGKGGAAA